MSICLLASLTPYWAHTFFFLSFHWPYPGLYCAVNHFSVIKGLYLIYCLIIIRTRRPLCSVTLQTMIKTFADIFPVLTELVQFSLLSHVWLFATPWIAAHQASLSITNFQRLPILISIKSVMPSNQLILCRPLLPPSIFPSIRVSSNESVLCIRWPKYWSFSFSISPSSEHSRLISFRTDWFDFTVGVKWNILCHINKQGCYTICDSVPLPPKWISEPS